MLDLLEDRLDRRIDLVVLVFLIHIDFVSCLNVFDDPIDKFLALHSVANTYDPVPGQLEDLLIVRQLVDDLLIWFELLQHLLDGERFVMGNCLDLDGIALEI